MFQTNQTDQIIQVWNIKGLHHQVAKIKGFENLSLWQRLKSFIDEYMDKLLV